MRDQDILARSFEEHRGRLRDIAYRMLGSIGEAEDAVQETWLRYANVAVPPDSAAARMSEDEENDRSADAAERGSGAIEIRNPAAWLTTVVSRICLDQLRVRTARREDPVDWAAAPEQLLSFPDTGYREPEAEAVLHDSVGRALLVVLRFLSPDERVAFVLHDMFAVPFDEIAPIVGRTPATTKKLASRARLRVRGESAMAAEEFHHRHEVVSAFLAAARSGDLRQLLDVLAPDVVRVADPAVLPPGVATTVRGAGEVAKETILLRSRSRVAGLALIDGDIGIVVAPHGVLAATLELVISGDRVVRYEVTADPIRLQRKSIRVILPSFGA
ncbi:sigma factor [Nocardia sp. NPDC052254]|uniref:sigma factor n=1 Tax=Nocardia sp. NPDC052254 TaxID=3155681 RepID=UPI003424FF98